MNFHPDLDPHPIAETAVALTAGHLTAGHLTADQIDDHLIGDLAAAPAAHLAACALCADRVAAVANPIASFQHVATAWSERRSATLPISVPAQQLRQRHMAWATACLTLAVGVAVVNATHQFSLQTATQTATQAAATQTAPSPAAEAASVPQAIAPPRAPALTETASIAHSERTTQIAADNHMLRAVNAAFDPFAESPAALGLTGSDGNRPPTSLQD